MKLGDLVCLKAGTGPWVVEPRLDPGLIVEIDDLANMVIVFWPRAEGLERWVKSALELVFND